MSMFLGPSNTMSVFLPLMFEAPSTYNVHTGDASLSIGKLNSAKKMLVLEIWRFFLEHDVIVVVVVVDINSILGASKGSILI